MNSRARSLTPETENQAGVDKVGRSVGHHGNFVLAKKKDGRRFLLELGGILSRYVLGSLTCTFKRGGEGQ